MDVIRAGALPESERTAVATHLECCSTCRVLLEANVSLPGRMGWGGVYSPLMLVAGLALGAVVLARCGGPTPPPATGTGTEVAKAPGENGATVAGEAAAGAPDAPQRAVPVQPHRAMPPAGKLDPAALPGQIPAQRRSGTPNDPRMLPPQSGLQAGSAAKEDAVASPGLPKASEEKPPPDLPEVPGPSAPPTDPNAKSTHPVAPAPPSGGAGPRVTPPSAPTTAGPGPGVQPSAPSAPKGPTTGPKPVTGPSAPKSPGTPEAKAAPAPAPGEAPIVKDETVESITDRRKLMDGSRSAGARAKAARRLAEAKAADAVPDLLAVAQSDVSLRLRTAAIEALGAIGDRSAVSGLQRLAGTVPLDNLELPALVAGALRRLGANTLLEQRARTDLADFSPRVRAQGALIAGGAESLGLASTLISLLDDRAVVSADTTKIFGRTPEGASRIEVRHAAWRALVLIAGGADYGFDAGEWQGWLKRRIAEGGAPPTVPAAPTTAGAEQPIDAALRSAAPELQQALRSRDVAVLHGLVNLLRSHTDYGRLATPPGDPYAPVAKKLGAFKSADARDAALASFYVAAFAERGALTEQLAAGLAGAGKAGRAAYVARLGAPGVQKLVAALESTAGDPEACYGAGGSLLRLLDAFRGHTAKRPFLDDTGKDLDARAADAEAFAAAVKEFGTWWRGLGVPHWDRATGRIVDGE